MSPQERPRSDQEKAVTSVDLQKLRDALKDAVKNSEEALKALADAQVVTQTDLRIEFRI
jgi:hypothetical protein